MKIANVICSVGVSGYFNKDLAAAKQGARRVGRTPAIAKRPVRFLQSARFTISQ